MGKYSNAFFSETTNMIKAKLYMNVHWMVLYNLTFFCSDMKFKMAATAGLSLTLDPMLSRHLLKLFYDELCSFSTFFALNFDKKLAGTFSHRVQC
jgi:hypothetical protein